MSRAVASDSESRRRARLSSADLGFLEQGASSNNEISNCGKGRMCALPRASDVCSGWHKSLQNKSK
jgi:hypothetical protein